MELLHHTNRPVADQVSAPVAARLQQSSSGLAILLAFFSAGLFWGANFLGAVPAWAWAIPALSSVATVGFWLFVPSDRLLKSGSLLSLAILSASLGALAQPDELKVFFAGFFALWLVNLTFFRLFFPTALLAAGIFWAIDVLLLALGLYFLPPPWSVETVPLCAGGFLAFTATLHFLWAQPLISRRHGAEEIFRGAMTCHLEICRVFVLWLIPNTEGQLRYEQID